MKPRTGRSAAEGAIVLALVAAVVFALLPHPLGAGGGGVGVSAAKLHTKGRNALAVAGDDAAASGVSAPAAAPAAAPEPPSPSWKCRVCEDVVQTWHDRFKCAGGSLQMEAARPNPFSPIAGKQQFQTCRQPKLDCNDLNEKLKPICKAMRYQFITRKEKIVWSTIMNSGNVYDTCIRLGKCINDTEQTDAKVCRDSFKKKECKEHLTCAPVQQHCSSSCFLCFNLVKDWPLFQQTCQPAGAKVDAEAYIEEERAQLQAGPKPSPTSKVGPTFLELTRRSTWSAEQEAAYRAHLRDEADRNFGPFGVPPPQKKVSDYWEPDLLTFLQLEAAEQRDVLDVLDDGAIAFLQTDLRAFDEHLNSEAAASAYDQLDAAQEDAEQELRAARQQRQMLIQLQQKQAAEAQQRVLARAAVKHGAKHSSGQRSKHAQRLYALSRDGARGGARGAVEADAKPKIPVTNSDTLPLKCHDMWDSIRYSKKARYFVQWLEEVSILPSGADRMSKQGLWDANVVCKCLGHCELSKFEYLGLEDVCKYGPPEQRTIDIALGAYMRDKPHDAVTPKVKEWEDDEEEPADDG